MKNIPLRISRFILGWILMGAMVTIAQHISPALDGSFFLYIVCVLATAVLGWATIEVLAGVFR